MPQTEPLPVVEADTGGIPQHLGELVDGLACSCCRESVSQRDRVVVLLGAIVICESCAVRISSAEGRA